MLELHFSDNCEEQMELIPGEIGVSMNALASTTSDCRLGYIRLLDISNRHIHIAAEIQKLGLLLLSSLLFELYRQKLTDYTYNKGVAGTKRKTQQYILAITAEKKFLNFN